MASTILLNVKPAGGSDDVLRSIIIDSGIIRKIGGIVAPDDNTADLGGATLVPGFLDIHIHGAVRVDVNEADVDGFLAIARFLARNGITAWTPTLVPDSDENYRRVIGEIDRLMEIQDGVAGSTGGRRSLRRRFCQ